MPVAIDKRIISTCERVCLWSCHRLDTKRHPQMDTYSWVLALGRALHAMSLFYYPNRLHCTREYLLACKINWNTKTKPIEKFCCSLFFYRKPQSDRNKSWCAHTCSLWMQFYRRLRWVHWLQCQREPLPNDVHHCITWYGWHLWHRQPWYQLGHSNCPPIQRTVLPMPVKL